MAYQSILNPMPVTAAALPLPAGAATSAKQPALGTAGAASTDVITVQGIASGVAQPISGTVTINAIPAGANTIGNVGLVAGAAVIGALTANQSVNVAQMNGVAVTMGSGVTGTGVQRVVLATDVALPTGANTIGAVTQSGTWNIGTLTTLPALVAGAAIIGKVGIDQTTPGTTNLVSIGTNGTVSLSAPSTTYSASVGGLVPALTATDIFTITGSASKTIRISKIIVNGVQTTAGQVAVSIIKRSTANTGGTSTAPAKVPYDSASAAATATVAAYTANPTTLGTVVGTLTANRLFVPGAATTSDAQGLMIAFGDVGQQYITLRGAAENLAINFNGVTIAGGAMNITIEWMES